MITKKQEGICCLSSLKSFTLRIPKIVTILLFDFYLCTDCMHKLKIAENYQMYFNCDLRLKLKYPGRIVRKQTQGDLGRQSNFTFCTSIATIEIHFVFA